MKLWTGLLLSASVLLGGGKVQRPDLYFKEGTRLVYSFYDHRDKQPERYRHVLLMKSVTGKAPDQLVNAVMTMSDAKTPNATVWSKSFASDSLHFYAYATNWCDVIVNSATVDQGVYTGDSLVYPLRMKIGDTLPGAFATSKKVMKNGSYTLRTLNFYDRKVEDADTLDLTFGKVIAYRVVAKVKWVYTTNGKDPGKEVYTLTEWFSPEFGLVKKKYDFGNGSYTISTLESISE
jgi:hypothetical protein